MSESIVLTSHSTIERWARSRGGRGPQAIAQMWNWAIGWYEWDDCLSGLAQ